MAVNLSSTYADMGAILRISKTPQSWVLIFGGLIMPNTGRVLITLLTWLPPPIHATRPSFARSLALLFITVTAIDVSAFDKMPREALPQGQGDGYQ